MKVETLKFCVIMNSIGPYSKRELQCFHGGFLTAKISLIPIFQIHKRGKILDFKMKLDFSNVFYTSKDICGQEG